MGVRPEALFLSSQPSATSTLHAKFNLIEPMGSMNVIWGEVGNTALTVLTGPNEFPAMEQSTPLSFAASAVSIFDRDGARI